MTNLQSTKLIMNSKMYKKRAGTSGIQGHLYETKLISLIYFRMIHDDRISEFSLATNRDDVGAFDDICFKAQVKGFDKPITMFIQAKHRENKTLFILSNNELVKYFESYLEIIRAFDPKSKDMIFGGNFGDNECFFVMYTTAKDGTQKKINEGPIADYLSELIGTGGSCTKPLCRHEDLDSLCKIVMTEQIRILAEQLAKFICLKPNSTLSMNNNDILLRYHVILALHVLDVTEIQPKEHRVASFRQDFFTTNDEFLVLFKNILCLEVLKKRKSKIIATEDVQSLLVKFFSDPTDITTVSKLIGSVLILKKGKLEFVSTSITDGQKRQLDKTNVPQSAIYDAAELAVKDHLLSLKLKVSTFFGNKDLAIRGNHKNIESRLDHLTSKMKEILKPNYIVTIDESMGDEMLQLNGGIGSAVGNILVLDETSSYLKFTDNWESLGKLAKTWYKTLNSEIEHLHEYRLDVKVKNFPKLLFNTNQADQNVAKNNLKDEIMTKEITTLAEQLAKFICDTSDSEISVSNNDIMLRYHVILALNVLDISEIQPEGYRVASFRQELFTTNEELLVLFKNILCLEVLKKRMSEVTEVQSILLKFLNEPSEITTLSPLLRSVILYYNSKLEFVSTLITDDQKRQLDKANVSQSAIYKAAELGAKDYLLSLQLKVSALFGNKDLAIGGNHKQIESRLNQLTSKMKDILKPNYVVTIDESMGDGNLKLNGGIGSAVSNILVFDETSKYLKFIDKCESLSDLAKKWYESLNSNIKNLHDFKLNVKVKNFPKLSFQRGEYDVGLVRDFYNKLLFYTNQADQNEVEEILREEIEDYPCNDVNNFRVRSDVIFLKYHNEIQKLWMTPGMTSYLTKKSEIYEKAVTNAMSEPLMGVFNVMHEIKNTRYIFNEEAVKRFKSHDPIIGTIIGSETFWLTVAMVEQYLGYKDHVVLDLEFIFKLPLRNHNNLCKELKNTTKNNILIIICNNFQDSSHSGKRLENIANAVDGKQVIIIINQILVDVMTKYLSQASNVLNNVNSVFTDLSVEWQKKLLAISKVTFQGKELCLDKIVDYDLAELIDDDIFNKMINNETIQIGDTAIYEYYEKQFDDVDRRVSRIKEQEQDKFDVRDKVLKTFQDLEERVVLITAAAGMGKSTLLTQLSRNTKQVDPAVWIVRINPDEETRLDGIHRICLYENEDTEILENMKALCQVAIGKDCDIKRMEEQMDVNVLFELERLTDGTFSLSKWSGPNSTAFQLNVFLHHFNRGKCVFLFDDTGASKRSLVKLIGSHPQKHVMWITRKGDKIFGIPRMQNKEWGPSSSYVLENFSLLEQDTYLNKLWKYKIRFKNLYSKDIKKIENYVFYLHHVFKENQYLRGFVLLLEFLKTESFCADLEFPYDEYYNNFVLRFGPCFVLSSCFPDCTTPQHLNALAERFGNEFKELEDNMSTPWLSKTIAGKAPYRQEPLTQFELHVQRRILGCWSCDDF